MGDGVGLRNFAYTGFYEIGKSEGFDVVYWNTTPFDLTSLGFSEIKIKNTKLHPFTAIYKNARTQIELNLFIRKTKDKVYDSYRFPFSYKTTKIIVKNCFAKMLIVTHSSNIGLKRIRRKIKESERKTLYYHQCLATLQKENPAIVFSTNQRLSTSIAPLLAAQDLGITTATFIFSWDNLPKATMVVETDYYFVWSEHMKKELRFYYPYINENQIIVTGTPQFESHFDDSKLIPKQKFFETYQLDLNKKYICYSGNDITTCPDDSQYLLDVAKAVRFLNTQGHSLGIIFRRCPVDFSNRYDKTLEDYKDIIVPIAPKWERKGEMWNAVLPTPEDLILQMNTIEHSDFVINLGSSMVFDYVARHKSCAYINYNVANKEKKDWSVAKIYNFVHFRSMPNKKTVHWIDNSQCIVSVIQKALLDNDTTIQSAEEWFQIINQHPPQNASKRIWKGIESVISKE